MSSNLEQDLEVDILYKHKSLAVVRVRSCPTHHQEFHLFDKSPLLDLSTDPEPEHIRIRIRRPLHPFPREALRLEPSFNGLTCRMSTMRQGQMERVIILQVEKESSPPRDDSDDDDSDDGELRQFYIPTRTLDGSIVLRVYKDARQSAPAAVDTALVHYNGELPSFDDEPTASRSDATEEGDIGARVPWRKFTFHLSAAIVRIPKTVISPKINRPFGYPQPRRPIHIRTPVMGRRTAQPSPILPHLHLPSYSPPVITGPFMGIQPIPDKGCQVGVQTGVDSTLEIDLHPIQRLNQTPGVVSQLTAEGNTTDRSDSSPININHTHGEGPAKWDLSSANDQTAPPASSLGIPLFRLEIDIPNPGLPAPPSSSDVPPQTQSSSSIVLHQLVDPNPNRPTCTADPTLEPNQQTPNLAEYLSYDPDFDAYNIPLEDVPEDLAEFTAIFEAQNAAAADAALDLAKVSTQVAAEVSESARVVSLPPVLGLMGETHPPEDPQHSDISVSDMATLPNLPSAPIIQSPTIEDKSDDIAPLNWSSDNEPILNRSSSPPYPSLIRQRRTAQNRQPSPALTPLSRIPIPLYESSIPLLLPDPPIRTQAQAKPYLPGKYRYRQPDITPVDRTPSAHQSRQRGNASGTSSNRGPEMKTGGERRNLGPPNTEGRHSRSSTSRTIPLPKVPFEKGPHRSHAPRSSPPLSSSSAVEDLVKPESPAPASTKTPPPRQIPTDPIGSSSEVERSKGKKRKFSEVIPMWTNPRGMFNPDEKGLREIRREDKRRKRDERDGEGKNRETLEKGRGERKIHASTSYIPPPPPPPMSSRKEKRYNPDGGLRISPPLKRRDVDRLRASRKDEEVKREGGVALTGTGRRKGAAARSVGEVIDFTMRSP